jgi:hypothetical protein
MVTSYGPNSWPTTAVEIRGTVNKNPKQFDRLIAEELERKTVL